MRLLSRYLLVGVLNTALGYAIIFACMYLLNLSPVLSNMIGYAVGLTTSYTLNRTFTFKSKAASRPEIIKFLFVFVLSYGANMIFLVLFIDALKFHHGISQILAGVIYIAASFLLNKYYVFHRASNIRG